MFLLFSRLRNILLPFAIAATAVIALSLGLVFLTTSNDSNTNVAQNPTVTPAVLDSTQTPVPTP